MNRNLLRALLGSTRDVPAYLRDLAWTQASAADDRELGVAAISSAVPMRADIRAQMASHGDPELRVAYLERADVDAAEAAALLAGERRLSVLIAAAPRWGTLDSHHQAVMAATTNGDDALAVLTSLTPQQFTCAEGSRLLAALPVGSLRTVDMFSPAGLWLSGIAGPTVSTLLGAADVDSRYSDAALAHLLCAPGRTDEAMAADTAAVVARVGSRIHTILSHYMVEFIGHTGESHLVCAHVQAWAARHDLAYGGQRLGDLPARLAVAPASTHRRDPYRYRDSAAWARRDPPDADTLLIAALHSPDPATRAPLHTYDSHAGGRTSPTPVLSYALTHTDPEIARLGWAHAATAHVDVEPQDYADALRRHGTDADIRGHLISMVTATAVSAHTLEDVDITVLVELVDQLHRHSENPAAAHRYRIDANLREAANALAVRGRPGDLNWAQLHTGRLRLSAPAHTAWADWLIAAVDATEVPERTWTVLGGLADTFTGSCSDLVTAAADIVADRRTTPPAGRPMARAGQGEPPCDPPPEPQPCTWRRRPTPTR